MKISPVPSFVTPPSNPDGTPKPSNVESVRKLKIATNVTPLTAQVPSEEEELPILDSNSSPTEAVVEATQPLSPQLALLAKQRRALQQQQKELKRQQDLLSQQTSRASIDIDRLKAEPLSVLLENGVTYDQLTEAVLANQSNSEIGVLRQELESLKQGIDQKFLDKEADAEKQVLSEMRREAEILSQSDDYELVRETRSIPKVIELIERTYRSTGEVLSVHEALKSVEDYLLEDVKKLTGLKKLQSQFSPVAEATPEPQQRQPIMRTLMNKDTAQISLGRKARAMAAFYGSLKK